ncbi:MAG TPA: PH domain-containing protein [Thermoanaerobaculia bacterium]|nr:PH domain-containing protein [Thermoanaerobaculia bacterium]
MTTPEPTAVPPRALDGADAPEENPVSVETPAPPPAPSIADGVERPLDPRHITVSRIGGWIFTGAVTLVQLVATAITWVSPAPGWVTALVAVLAVAVTLALGWLSHRWPVVEHRHASYKVDEQGIEMRRGVYWRRVINVPRSRVQHTDVSQGPLERRYGLGTLVIYTAGTDHAKVDLSGLDHASALAIRDHLLLGEGGDAV